MRKRPSSRTKKLVAMSVAPGRRSRQVTKAASPSRCAAAAEDPAPALHHAVAADQCFPAGMDAGDGRAAGPDGVHRLRVGGGERRVEGRVGGQHLVLVRHARGSITWPAAAVFGGAVPFRIADVIGIHCRMPRWIEIRSKGCTGPTSPGWPPTPGKRCARTGTTRWSCIRGRRRSGRRPTTSTGHCASRLSSSIGCRSPSPAARW